MKLIEEMINLVRDDDEGGGEDWDSDDDEDGDSDGESEGDMDESS